jgi:hypothetical protein
LCTNSAINVQNSAWVFDGVLESSADLFPLYVQEKLCNIPVALNPRGSREYRDEWMHKYNFKHPDFALWKRYSEYSQTFYVQLQQAFGWGAFQAVFAQYGKLARDQQPRTDEDKRDEWMVRFSRQVGRNLGPFFAAWGVPTSERAQSSIADLPTWMPEELQAFLNR